MIQSMNLKEYHAKFHGAMSTNALTKAVIDLFTLKGYKVWRQNTAGIYDEKKGVYRSGSATKGISDVIGFHKQTGKFVAIEIKTGKDKLSSFQQNFLNDVAQSGADAYVIHNSIELENLKNII